MRQPPCPLTREFEECFVRGAFANVTFPISSTVVETDIYCGRAVTEVVDRNRGQRRARSDGKIRPIDATYCQREGIATNTVSDDRVRIWFFFMACVLVMLVAALLIVFTTVPGSDQLPPRVFLGGVQFLCFHF